jgi:GT2 family glycosyltransferase
MTQKQAMLDTEQERAATEDGSILDLTISIINTNNREMVMDCLGSVYGNTLRSRMEVFVVDNACSDGSAEAIIADFPQVKLIRNDQKLGFSTNNNMVFQQAKGRYLLMLNDDTLVQPGALDNMVEFMNAHPEAGASGAKLLNPDGTNQPAFDDFPGLRDFIQPLWARLRPGRWDTVAPKKVSSVSGACMLVRRKAAFTVGLLDTAFDPLYVEEREWCDRIRQQGWDIYHLPSARVIHFGGQSSKHTPEVMTQHVYTHRLLFCKKHYALPETVLYRITLFIVSLLKAAGWGCKALLEPRKTRKGAIQRMHCHLVIARNAWS